MFAKLGLDTPENVPKIGKLGNTNKKAVNPLWINDFHFGRLRRERQAFS